MFCIYKHTSPSGKSYIGQTKDYNSRCVSHKKSANCRAFSSAIKKHGWDSFTHEILKENLSIEEANFWEEFYIKEHLTISPYGYNLNFGGNNRLASDETRLRLSLSTRERNIGNVHSKETREKISKSLSGRKNKPCSEEIKLKISGSNKGKVRSKEHRLLMSLSMIGRVANNKKGVSIHGFNFQSVKDACVAIGLTSSSLIELLKSENQRWSCYFYIDGNFNPSNVSDGDISDIRKKHKFIADKHGRIAMNIKRVYAKGIVFDSITLAALHFGVCRDAIGKKVRSNLDIHRDYYFV